MCHSRLGFRKWIRPLQPAAVASPVAEHAPEWEQEEQGQEEDVAAAHDENHSRENQTPKREAHGSAPVGVDAQASVVVDARAACAQGGIRHVQTPGWNEESRA